MVSVLASSAVDRGSSPVWVQNKDYVIGIWYFSSNDADLISKTKDCGSESW